MIHFSQDTILSILPQRPPIVMVDELWVDSSEHAFTTLTVRADNWFYLEGALLEAGIVEHIAQSGAAMIGARTADEAPHIGYIGELKNIQFSRLPLLGETLHTELSIVAEAAGISLLEATVKILSRSASAVESSSLSASTAISRSASAVESSSLSASTAISRSDAMVDTKTEPSAHSEEVIASGMIKVFVKE